MSAEYTYLLSNGRRFLEWKRLNDAPVPAGFQKHEGRLYRRPVAADAAYQAALAATSPA